MPDSVLIADELLAEALDWPRDPRSVEVVNRPDPWEKFWKDFLVWAETSSLKS